MGKTGRLIGYGIFVAILAFAGQTGSAGDAVELLRARDGELRGYVDINYHNAPLQRILFDLRNANAGVNIVLRAESVGAEQDLLAERVSIGPVRGLAWEDALRYVAEKMDLVVDAARASEGVIVLEKTPRFSGVFDGVRLGDAIHLITENAGANVVVSPRVNADEAVHLTFSDVPWRDALRSVLKAHGCTFEMDAAGGIVRVLTLEEAPARLETLSRPLRYLRPGSAEQSETLASLLDALRRIASGNGVVVYEKGANSLVLTDVADKVAEMARVVDVIDAAPYQVAIETSLIDMDMEPADFIAANWLVRNASPECEGGGDVVWEAVCAVHGDKCAGVSASMTEPLPAPAYSVGALSTAEAAAVLRASLYSDAVSVTQAPQMTVLDRETAMVSVGATRAGVEERHAGGAAAPAYSHAELFSGIRLTMTPRVCGDGDQVMLEVCYQQYGDSFASADGSLCGGTVRTVRTTMLLHSGETGIIAGLLQDGPRRGAAAGGGKFARKRAAKPVRRHSVIMVTPILMVPPDDAKFEKDVAALRESLALVPGE